MDGKVSKIVQIGWEFSFFFFFSSFLLLLGELDLFVSIRKEKFGLLFEHWDTPKFFIGREQSSIENGSSASFFLLQFTRTSFQICNYFTISTSLYIYVYVYVYV